MAANKPRFCTVDGRRYKRISRLGAIYAWKNNDIEMQVLQHLLRGPASPREVSEALGHNLEAVSDMMNEMREVGLLQKMGDTHTYQPTIEGGMKVIGLRNRAKTSPPAKIIAVLNKRPKKRAKSTARIPDDLKFRAQHGELINRNVTMIGAPGVANQSPLDRMWRRKEISTRQHIAGERLRDDYELGIVGARDPEKNKGHSSPSGGGMSGAQIAAAHAFNRGISRLQRELAGIVIDVVCGEMTIRDIAELRQRDHQKIMGLFEFGLDVLGDHYGLKTEVSEERLKVGTKVYSFTYKHEPNGQVCGVRLGGKAWTVCAEDEVALVRLARKAIREAGKGSRVHQAKGTRRSAAAPA